MRLNKECAGCKEILNGAISARNDFSADERYLHGLEDVMFRRQRVACKNSCTLVGEYRKVRDKLGKLNQE